MEISSLNVQSISYSEKNSLVNGKSVLGFTFIVKISFLVSKCVFFTFSCASVYSPSGFFWFSLNNHGSRRGFST